MRSPPASARSSCKRKPAIASTRPISFRPIAQWCSSVDNSAVPSRPLSPDAIAFLQGAPAPGWHMADQDDDPQQDDAPEPEQRFFTVTEAERARREVEPFLVEAMNCRKKLAGLDQDLTAVSARIMMMGGVIVPYERLAKLRAEHSQLAEAMKAALNRIRFYHRQDEGFAGRKPLDPRDLGPGEIVQ